MATVAHTLRWRGGSPRLAVPVALACAGACVASVAAVLGEGRWSLSEVRDLPVDAVVGTSYAAMGAVVLSGRRTSRRLGWLLVAIGVAAALVVITTAFALLADGPTATARLAVHLQSWLWVPGFIPLLTVLPLIYPDGRLVGRRWRVWLGTSIAGMALLAAGTALHPQGFPGTVVIEQPWTSEPVSRVLFPAGVVLLVPSTLAAVASLTVRLRRSDGVVRRQVVVFLVAAAAVVTSALTWDLLPQPVGTLAQAFAVGLLPVAIAVAVTRHGLYDLDLAIRRSLVVVSLAACLAGAYLTLFFLLRAAAPGRTAMTSALAAAATGVLVHPLGVRLARGVDRLFYGDRADPYAVVSTLSRRLSAGLDVREVPSTVCSTVISMLRLSSAELRLTGSGRALASAGAPSGSPTSFDLRHRGEVVGTLMVTPRLGERRLDERDASLLSALVDQAAPAVAALRLTEDLQRSREALVAAREEERRRLRRELHDGVGAALAGVRLQLDAARDLVDDSRAARILDAAVAGVSEAVGDVRRITDDLRPPALDQLGLAGSLEALGDRLRTPALSVSVDVGELPGLPAATEVACYRIAAEAVANAVRHARARHVALSTSVAGDAVTLVVRDDGVGLGTSSASAGSGLGIASMRQRAEEIGGALSLESTSSGTTVRAVLPR